MKLKKYIILYIFRYNNYLFKIIIKFKNQKKISNKNLKIKNKLNNRFKE